jgi:hypothetical protein
MPANAAEVTANYELNTLPVVNAGDDQNVPFVAAIPWTPESVATAAWYDASDAGTLWADAGVTPATSSVQRWDDKSGNGKHAVAAAGSEPTYTSGTSSVSGTDSTPMTLPNDLYASASSGCVVWVGTQDTGGAGWGNYGGNNNIHSPWTDGYIYDAFLSNSRAKASTTVSNMLGTQTMQSRVQTGTNLEMWSDGSQVYNGAQSFNGNPSEAKLFDFGSYTLNELVFLPDADLETREKVEGYLAHKWGLENNLPTAHPYKAFPPVFSGAVANLDGTATDADGGDSLTTTWSIVSKDPASAADPIFDDASLPITTAIFSEEGTYVLRLTADDGWASVSDDVVINVSTQAIGSVTTNHSVPHIWLDSIDPSWSNDYEAAVTNDPDGDGFSTWEEYWSGTDPTNASSRLEIESLHLDGTNMVMEWRHARVNTGIPDILIQASSNLTVGPWTTVGTKSPVNGTNTWQNGLAPPIYFRLVAPTAP